MEAYPRPVLSRRSQPSSPGSQVGEFRPVAKPLPARDPAPTRRRHAPRPSPRRLGVFRRWGPAPRWHELAVIGNIWAGLHRTARRSDPCAEAVRRARTVPGTTRLCHGRFSVAGRAITLARKSVRLSRLTRPQSQAGTPDRRAFLSCRGKIPVGHHGSVARPAPRGRIRTATSAQPVRGPAVRTHRRRARGPTTDPRTSDARGGPTNRMAQFLGFMNAPRAGWGHFLGATLGAAET